MSMNRILDSRGPWDRRHGPAHVAAGDGQEGAYSAVLVNAPSGGKVRVKIPALGLTYYRTATCSTSFTGSAGDNVLVIFDEQKHPWVVATAA